MTIANAIGKLERNGFMVSGDGMNFRAANPGNQTRVIEFGRNGREDSVVCIRSRHVRDMDDSMSDYCAGCWHDTITQAIKAII